MDSKEFMESTAVKITAENVGDGRFVMEFNGNFVRVDADIVYQWMAERFRRENVAERGYTDWSGVDATWCVETADIVEKSDDA